MSDKPDGGHGHDSDPMTNLWMAMTGASAGHHEEVPGIDPHAMQVGHEPDKFDARTIVYVPIVVTITLVITYLIVQGAFAFVNGRESRQLDEYEFNNRAARIATTDARPLEPRTEGEKPLGAVPQPRLEYIRQMDKTRMDVNANPVTDPPFLRSYKPTPTGNSPEIYPEDLRAEHFIDPTTKAKSLVEPGWVVKDKLAVIPIDEAIHLMTTDDKFKLPVAKSPAVLTAGTIGKSRLSNGGLPAPVPVAKKDEPKKADDRKH
jgi:hypothetical protein